jgi:hypothetical protein
VHSRSKSIILGETIKTPACRAGEPVLPPGHGTAGYSLLLQILCDSCDIFQKFQVLRDQGLRLFFLDLLSLERGSFKLLLHLLSRSATCSRSEETFGLPRVK